MSGWSLPLALILTWTCQFLPPTLWWWGQCWNFINPLCSQPPVPCRAPCPHCSLSLSKGGDCGKASAQKWFPREMRGLLLAFFTAALISDRGDPELSQLDSLLSQLNPGRGMCSGPWEDSHTWLSTNAPLCLLDGSDTLARLACSIILLPWSFTAACSLLSVQHCIHFFLLLGFFLWSQSPSCSCFSPYWKV